MATKELEKKAVAKAAPKATAPKAPATEEKKKAAPKPGAAKKTAPVPKTAPKVEVLHEMTEKRKSEAVIAGNSADKNLDLILQLKNITKTFLGGKIIANDNVSLSFARNEVHAIVGENGSGKSTLMNIIFGLYKQDKGSVYINKKKVDMYHAGAAKKYRIGMVHQHFHLVDEFTVLENVIIGQEELIKSRREKKKLRGLKKELKSVTKQIKGMRKLPSILLDPAEAGGKKEIEEKNNNFIDGVTHLLELRHISQGEIINEENIIKGLKNERERISRKKQTHHHEKQIEKINDEILDRKAVIETETKAIKLVDEYEHKATNGDQEKAVELIERQYELKREIRLLDVKLTGLFGRIKVKEVMDRINEIQIKYNIHIDPHVKVKTLSVGQRQMVEILKVLWEEKDIIVFDEPTATLSVVEIEELMKTIKALKKEGKTIIFISHKLKEVKAIADRISVLRKGTMMGTYKNDASLTPAKIGELMVGKTIELNYPARNIEPNPMIKFDNVSYMTSSGFMAVTDVSFEIYEGEIFGLAGIEGNGQEELVKILTNHRKPYKGSVSRKKETVKKSEAKHLMKENAQIEHDQIIEEAHIAESKLQLHYLDNEIRQETKAKIREARMNAIDEKARAIAKEGKRSKGAVKQIDHDLKELIKQLKHEEHDRIKELHTHDKKKELHDQVKAIHKQAKADAKAVMDNVKQRIKNKDIDTVVWDRLTESDHGYHLSGTHRREIQSYVPIDRLKHGVVPTKDLEFNAKITDYDIRKFKRTPRKQKPTVIENNDIKFANMLVAKENRKALLTEGLEAKRVDLENYTNELNALNASLESADKKAKSEIKLQIKELNDVIKNTNSDISAREKDLANITKRIENHEKEKKAELSKMMKPLYGFTQNIIDGMKVDGAFNHQVEIRNLSGGNQQKFVVGREMFRDHEIFVAGHPTRGLDISAIDHIYTKMIENAPGKATLLYSLEINELMAVCDRIAVMYHGKIVDIINPKETTLEEVSRMMIGEVQHG